MQRAPRSALQAQVQVTLQLRSRLLLASSLSPSLPTRFPGSPPPPSTSLTNRWYANPHLSTCFWGAQPETLPEAVFAVTAVVAAAGCLCACTRCDAQFCPRRGPPHTVLRFLRGQSAAHPVPLGPSQGEMAPSLCQEGRAGPPRALQTPRSAPPWR